MPLGGGSEVVALVVLVGGVCDRAPDRIVPLSVGDSRCARAWGTEFSNISWRSTAEYVRFASSAMRWSVPCSVVCAVQTLTLLEVQLVVRRAF